MEDLFIAEAALALAKQRIDILEKTLKNVTDSLAKYYPWIINSPHNPMYKTYTEARTQIVGPDEEEDTGTYEPLYPLTRLSINLLEEEEEEEEQ